MDDARNLKCPECGAELVSHHGLWPVHHPPIAGATIVIDGAGAAVPAQPPKCVMSGHRLDTWHPNETGG